jgi:hypothetical protein
MGRFKLVFSLEVKRNRGGKQIVGDGGIVERVIIVNDKETAEKIGLAMIGEEIFPLQYIKELLGADSTDEAPFLNSFSDEYTWRRVLVRLGLDKGDVFFVFCTRDIPPAESISGGRTFNRKAERIVEGVGVELTHPQREYVLSIIL